MYFDLNPLKTIQITDFIVNGQPGDWSVWYKSGTFAGSELDPGAWTLMGSGTTTSTVDTLHVGGLTIGAGVTEGIYIFDFGTADVNSGEQNYDDGFATYSNADLILSGGTGNYGAAFSGGGPFSDTLADRVWSGTVDYTTGGVPEPASWAMMIVGMFGLGSVVRRRRPAVATA